MNYEARFGGIGRLYGNSGLSLLRSARIAVVGIGGVGSWAAEALARSGVGTIILMDMDDLCITNTNRQIHALASTIGQSKTETMATRIREINPEAEVIPISNFYTASNAEKLLSAEPDVIIDAIDSLIPKAHLIASCYRGKQPLVTCGGAGGRINPARIEIDDLSRTRGDPLLSSLRYRLKKDYALPLGEKARKLKIPCVFSQETPVYPTCDGTTSCTRDPEFQGKMGCDAGFGSVTHITGTFGFFAASAAIQMLLNKKKHHRHHEQTPAFPAGGRPPSRLDPMQHPGKDIAGINARNAEIAREPRGNYFVGRRYHVPATRFWGYLRQPGQTWRTAQLVIMDESACRTPDRLPEYTGNPRYAYDNNYEYRVYGKYTGKYGYEPNSNLRLPIFKPTRFEVANTTPGWLFKPSENMIPEPLLCALLSCPRQTPSRSGKKNLSAKTGPER